MRIEPSTFTLRTAGLLFTGLALVACDPKILLGEFGDSDTGPGQSSGDTQGQSSGGDDGGDGGDDDGGSSESGTGGETGDEEGCDPWLQDCPTGQKCAPYDEDEDGPTWDAFRCVALDPTPTTVGSSCQITGDYTSGEDDCELGAVCWEADLVTFEGTCVALCQGSPQSATCDAGTHCTVLNDGVLNLCLPDCDPLAQDCEAGQTCIPIPESDEFICVLDAGGAEGQAFDTCEFLNACDPGLLCADPELASECSPSGPGCCLPFCDVSAANTCPGVDQECLPWFAPMQAPPGKEDLGICGVGP